MATAAKSSFGTLLKLGDGGGTEVFTTIAEVLDIKGPGIKLNTEDATSHSSTAGWEEKVATTLTPGQIKFDVNWIPGGATQSYSAGLLRDQVNKTLRNFQLVIPAASTVTWTFAAFVTQFEPDLPVKGKQKASITLELSGQPTLA